MSYYFNPRSPCGERLAGCDYGNLHILISIHAPRVGSDMFEGMRGMFGKYFNPRSPCGERPPIIGGKHETADYFNPRSPCGERHRKLIFPLHFLNFNPRSPCGERPISNKNAPAVQHFNPRSPCGERRLLLPTCSKPIQFQSTLPVWGATQ